jgi:hypothetical protein
MLSGVSVVFIAVLHAAGRDGLGEALLRGSAHQSTRGP